MAAAALTLLALLALEPAAAGNKDVPVRLAPFRYFAGPAPAGWSEAAFDDKAWAGPAEGPFAPRPPPPVVPQPPPPPGTPPPVGTSFDSVPGAPVLLRAPFALDAARAKVLELRIAYGDGFVAYVNGREVARRGVIGAPGGGLTGEAVHGPEFERIPIPVPSPEIPSLKPTGNVLAVAVYPWVRRAAVVPVVPAAAIELGAASGVRIVRGPYLTAPREDKKTASVRVRWQTDLPRGAVVSVGTRRIQVRPAIAQDIVIGGLDRGRRYQYSLELEDAGGDVARSGPWTFQTLPAPPTPLRFAVYGDMRYPGHEAHKAVIAALVREAPAVVFNTGDLTDESSQEANWQRYFEITAPLGAIAPVVPALGNHDWGRAGIGAAKTWAAFDMPALPAGQAPGWASLDLGGAHFVMLDTNQARSAAQREWLKDDLAQARRHHARALFAFCHEPPWSQGVHGNSSVMIRDYAPLLAAAHVDMLFCGHDHLYERGTGTTPAGKLPYIVTGGGGAPLYNPRCHAATGPAPGDVPGPLPVCPASVATLVKTYHYIIVDVSKDGIRLCPRRPDGTEVEPCVKLPPHR
jgi:hypothetical protein